MRNFFILLLIFTIISIANAQSDSTEIKYFVKYNYSSIGTNKYNADNPFERIYFYNEFGVRFNETYSDPGNNFGFGLALSKQLFFVLLLNLSYDSYSFGINEFDIESEVSLLTIGPYIGLKRYFLHNEKINSFLQVGIFKRFSFANSKDYVFPEDMKEDFESAIEDVSSPLRFFLELGIEYSITDNLRVGISMANYLEIISGKAIGRGDYNPNIGDYEKFTYDLSKNRFGQYYNLNLLIYF